MVLGTVYGIPRARLVHHAVQTSVFKPLPNVHLDRFVRRQSLQCAVVFLVDRRHHGAALYELVFVVSTIFGDRSVRHHSLHTGFMERLDSI